MTASLTLDALSAEVTRRLDAAGLGSAQGDRRVAATADSRTIRYYTTLGLVDQPARRDRHAVYGERQVLQVAAIKALQARRLPLAEIQRRLLGRSDAELRALLAPAAGAPQGVLAAAPALPAGTRVARWREVTLEPGLRLVVDEAWVPGAPLPVLLGRLGHVLEAFAGPTPALAAETLRPVASPEPAATPPSAPPDPAKEPPR